MIEKVNVSDCIVICGLVAALVMSIIYDQKELALSIASGLIGYLSAYRKNKEDNEK